MKSVISQVLVLGLLFSQVAQAGVVRRYTSDDAQAKAIVRALELSPSNMFECKWVAEGKTGRDSVRNSVEHGLDLLTWVSSGNNFTLTQYDSPTPLFDFYFTAYGQQLVVYTNSQQTEISKIVLKKYETSEVNKGTLANPKIVKEPTLANSTTCVKR